MKWLDLFGALALSGAIGLGLYHLLRIFIKGAFGVDIESKGPPPSDKGPTLH